MNSQFFFFENQKLTFFPYVRNFVLVDLRSGVILFLNGEIISACTIFYQTSTFVLSLIAGSGRKLFYY
jgi:hypothetical protein